MGRLSTGELALERDEDMEGRASGEDRRGDDTWLERHSQPSVPEVLSRPLLQRKFIKPV